jgi:hypothetical protein
VNSTQSFKALVKSSRRISTNNTLESVRMQEVEIHSKESKTKQELLTLALDIEDKLAHSIYSDYMCREYWPAELKNDAFEKIRKYLQILIEDTERHRNTVEHLQSKPD